jgi:hypothetical protein
MNKKILIGALAVVLALALAFCAIPREDVTEPTQAATDPVPAPTAEPTEYTLPIDEGVEDIPAEIEETESATEPAERDDEPEASEPEETETEETGSEATIAPTEAVVPTVPEETIAPTDPASGEEAGYCCEYAEFLTWSASAQQSFMNGFASPMDYIAWCRAGEAAHADHNTSIEVEGGELNVGDFIG